MPQAKTPPEIWGAQWMETKVKTTAEHLAQAINKVLRRFFFIFFKGTEQTEAPVSVPHPSVFGRGLVDVSVVDNNAACASNRYAWTNANAAGCWRFLFPHKQFDKIFCKIQLATAFL